MDTSFLETTITESMNELEVKGIQEYRLVVDRQRRLVGTQTLTNEVEALIERCLESTPESMDLLSQLYVVRFLFESAFAVRLNSMIKSREPDYSIIARSRLEALQDEMSQIASESRVCDDVLEKFWRKDGEFHATLGILVERPLMAEVVQIVQGNPTLANRMLPTSSGTLQRILVEHGQIIDLIFDDKSTEGMILGAIRQHLSSAIKSWLPQISRRISLFMDERIKQIGNPAPPDRSDEYRVRARQVLGRECPELEEMIDGEVRRFDEECKEESVLDLDYSIEQLILEFAFPGSYIAYCFIDREKLGQCRRRLKVLFHNEREDVFRSIEQSHISKNDSDYLVTHVDTPFSHAIGK